VLGNLVFRLNAWCPKVIFSSLSVVQGGEEDIQLTLLSRTVVLTAEAEGLIL
jgi:hypothetical protein